MCQWWHMTALPTFWAPNLQRSPQTRKTSRKSSCRANSPSHVYTRSKIAPARVLWTNNGSDLPWERLIRLNECVVFEMRRSQSRDQATRITETKGGCWDVNRAKKWFVQRLRSGRRVVVSHGFRSRDCSSSRAGVACQELLETLPRVELDRDLSRSVRSKCGVKFNGFEVKFVQCPRDKVARTFMSI